MRQSNAETSRSAGRIGPSAEERMIRELILQLKLRLESGRSISSDKYQVDILERFQRQFDSLSADGCLADATPDIVSLTRDGLLRVDALLSRFFLPRHAGIRYT